MPAKTPDSPQAPEPAATSSTPKITVETQFRKDAASSYFDGVAGVNIGPSVAKIDFFKAIVTRYENGDLHEDREVVYSAVIPTLAFFEMVSNTMEGAIENRDLIVQTLNEVLDKVAATAKRAAAKT